MMITEPVNPLVFSWSIETWGRQSFADQADADVSLIEMPHQKCAGLILPHVELTSKML